MFIFSLFACNFTLASCLRSDCTLPQRITTRWVLLGLLAVVRNLQWLTEQPQSSLMPSCPYFTFAALVVRPSFWGHIGLFDAQVRVLQCCMPTLSCTKHNIIWSIISVRLHDTNEAVSEPAHVQPVSCWYLRARTSYHDIICVASLSKMGAYKHDSDKPSVCFGTASRPQMLFYH